MALLACAGSFRHTRASRACDAALLEGANDFDVMLASVWLLLLLPLPLAAANLIKQGQTLTSSRELSSDAVTALHVSLFYAEPPAGESLDALRVQISKQGELTVVQSVDGYPRRTGVDFHFNAPASTGDYILTVTASLILSDGQVRRLEERQLAQQPGAGGKTLRGVADYLYRNRTRMRYDEYLANGWPIASGPVEGACKNLIKDRSVPACAGPSRWLKPSSSSEPSASPATLITTGIPHRTRSVTPISRRLERRSKVATPN